jgi:hypothetical protein
MRFSANCVTCQTRDGVALLGFADDEFNTTQYVLLQRELGPQRPEDREAGFDKPHIEVNSQTHSGYGGVMDARLHETSLVLRLDPQAAARMFVDDTIEIAIRVPSEKLDEIGEQLRLLLGNDIVRVEGRT